MRIGIDGRAAKWYRGTGIGTYTYQLINNLSKVDISNNYTVFLPEGSSLDFNNNFLIQPTKSTSNNNFWEEVHLPNVLLDNNLQLYHVPQNGVGLSHNIDCNKVITLHDIIPLKMPETVSDRYLKIFNNEMPKIIDNCQGIITVSEFSKQDISKEFNFPKDKIFVTHLAAENIYKPLDKSNCKNIIKSEFGIDKNFILYVGGFSPRKNILGIIEAFSLLDKSIRDKFNLVITGKKGISYSKYKNRSIELNIADSVIFTDFIPLSKLPIFYNASELLVYPSLYEGFGLPPLEAMACGTPVIASNVTSIPEVCSDSAILVNPYDIDELKAEMENILNNNTLRLSLINKGFNSVNKYSWRNTAIKTVKCYESIVKFNN